MILVAAWTAWSRSGRGVTFQTLYTRVPVHCQGFHTAAPSARPAPCKTGDWRLPRPSPRRGRGWHHRCRGPHKTCRSGVADGGAAQGDQSELSGDAQVAVIVPGLLYGADSYGPLCQEIAARGYRAVVVPMEWWHWIPCLGGRCMRPVLERIDFAVDYVLAYGASAPVPMPSYNVWDFFSDFFSNPGGALKVGGSSDPDAYPSVEPAGEDFSAESRQRRLSKSAQARVALVGHSAGGWISRIFLGGRGYAGRTYNGTNRVHSLVTLGSPHAPAPGVAFKALEWLERDGSSLPPSVRCLAVGSKGIVAGEAADFTRNAYRFCGAKADDDAADGDGVTPLFSAHALEGADLLTLEGLTHASEYPAFGPTAELSQRRSEGQPWYGSPTALEAWLTWLRDKA